MLRTTRSVLTMLSGVGRATRNTTARREDGPDLCRRQNPWLRQNPAMSLAKRTAILATTTAAAAGGAGAGDGVLRRAGRGVHEGRDRVVLQSAGSRSAGSVPCGSARPADRLDAVGPGCQNPADLNCGVFASCLQGRPTNSRAALLTQMNLLHWDRALGLAAHWAGLAHDGGGAPLGLSLAAVRVAPGRVAVDGHARTDYFTGPRSTGSRRRIGVGLPSRLSVTR